MNEIVTVSIVEQCLEKLAALRTNIEKVFIGQPSVVEQVIIALLAEGHVLIEGVPGLGKTLLVHCLSTSVDSEYKRVQFTPDLMPSDILGHSMFDQQSRSFHIRKGPAFTNFLLADEINRSPAKTQAALLEVMQERQITIEGDIHPAPHPFMVLATQNPIEHEGTYPLPEAELDRFLMKIFINYPTLVEEITLTKLATSDIEHTLNIDSVLNKLDIVLLQKACAQLTIDDKVIEYAIRLCQSTRNNPVFSSGAGPRASIALVRCAKANALLRGNHFVLPDDIKNIALPVLRHRVKLSIDMEIEGRSADQLIEQLLLQIDAPRI